MSRVAPAQVSFNAGEVSTRLRARIDQGLYEIALAEMIGFAPLVEGPAEAMPGTIHVDEAPGPSRVVRFEFSTTQGHVLEFSDGLVRVFTNDALITTLASPYSWAQAQELTFHQSYDVLYCFHPEMQTREFYRSGPTSFGFDLYAPEDGPFEPQNRDKAVRISASALTGTVTLEATGGAPFVATDEGRLIELEAEDFGDITAWEPYITVTEGQYLSANDRVYRVVGGNPDGDAVIRTGTLTPVHTEGVEWDGIAKGSDINGEPAGGVRLEYIHDRRGVVRIDSYVSATEVEGEVLRTLPFSATSDASYEYTGGYWDETYGVYVPPTTTVTYSYGTYRWSLGSFSDTSGWPRCGAVWDERLCLAKDSTIYPSVRGDFTSHAARNAAGEVSNDMAVIATLQDANPVRYLVATGRLLALTAAGVHALGPASPAAGFGPTNASAEKQHDAGCGSAAPVLLNGRTLHIDRSGRRIYETEIDGSRGREAELDLTRYARQIGVAELIEVAAQQHPFNHLWAVRGDGSLACGAYLPEERVLGWAQRPLAAGIAARSVCAITDPAGLFDQVWLTVEYGGGWHTLRMAAWRHDGEVEETPCMTDMAALYEGAPDATLNHPFLPEATLHIVADGRFYARASDADGDFTIPEAGAKVWAGLPFAASLESLNFEMGGDNGAARARKARFGRAWCEVIGAQGLAFGPPGDLVALEELEGDSDTDSPFAAYTGFRFREATGDWTRAPRLRIERQAPFQATVAAWGGTLNMEAL